MKSIVVFVFVFAFQSLAFSQGITVQGSGDLRRDKPTSQQSKSPAPADTTGTQSTKPLTNTDIVAMVKGGLAESTVILAIEQSAGNFDTSPTALVLLKDSGASAAIIEAMLRSKGAETSSTVTTAIQPPTSETVVLAEGTYYRSPSGWVRMQPQMMGGGGATHVGKMFIPGLTPHVAFTFRGSEAPVRITETRPVFYVKQNPNLVNVAGRTERDIVLVRFDKKKDHRELQMTSGGTMFNFKSGFSKERTPDIVVTRISETIFTVTPKADLPAGEYLLTYGLGSSGFDFGVLPQKP